MRTTDRDLRRLGAWLAAASLALAVLLPLATASVWFAADPAVLAAQAGLPAGTRPGGWQVLAGGLVALVPVGLLSLAMLAARRCFLLFRRGAYLTAGTVAALRAFAARVVLSGLAGLLAPTLLGLLLSAGNPAGGHSLVLSLSGTPLLGLMFGGTLWAIAGVMARAVAIAEDHAQIV